MDVRQHIEVPACEQRERLLKIKPAELLARAGLEMERADFNQVLHRSIHEGRILTAPLTISRRPHRFRSRNPTAQPPRKKGPAESHLCATCVLRSRGQRAQAGITRRLTGTRELATPSGVGSPTE